MIWICILGNAPRPIDGWALSILRAVGLKNWNYSSQEVGSFGKCALIGEEGLLPPKPVSPAKLSGVGFFFESGSAKRIETLADSNQICNQIVENDSLDGQYCALAMNGSEYIIKNDLYGLKPIYYSVIEGQIHASSDIRAILIALGGRIAPNYSYAYRFIDPRGVLEDNEENYETAYDAVYKVPVLHYLSWTPSYRTAGNNLKIIKSAWSPPIADPSINLDIASSKLQDILQSCVGGLVSSQLNRQLFDLSGGIDSASVIGAALQQGLHEQIKATSLTFGAEGHYSNDRDLIDEFALQHGFPVAHVDGSSDIQASDYYTPFLGPTTISSIAALVKFERMAKTEGSRYRFTGEGADFHYAIEPILFDHFIQNGRYKAAILSLERTWPSLSNHVRMLFVILAMAKVKPSIYAKIFNESKKYELSIDGLYTKTGVNRIVNSRKDDRYKIGILGERTIARRQQVGMLFPRSAYIDVLSHFPTEIVSPYLHKSAIELALLIPADVHVDMDHIEPGNDYASQKAVIRHSFANSVPDRIRSKRTKTIYNDLAMIDLRRTLPRMEQEFGSSKNSLLSTGVVDEGKLGIWLDFFREVSKYDATSLGGDYLLLRRVYETEIWLNRLSDPMRFMDGMFYTHH